MGNRVQEAFAQDANASEDDMKICFTIVRVIKSTISAGVAAVASELSAAKREITAERFAVGYQDADAEPLDLEAIHRAVRQVAPYSAEHTGLVRDLFAELAESERRWENAQLRQGVEGLLRETIETADAAAAPPAAPAAAVAAGGQLSEAERAAFELQAKDAALAEGTVALFRAHLALPAAGGPGGEPPKSVVEVTVAKQIDEVHNAAMGELTQLLTKAQRGNANSAEAVERRLENYGLGRDAVQRGAAAAYLQSLLTQYSTTNNLLRALTDLLLRAIGTFAARNTGLAEMDEVSGRVLDILRDLGVDPIVLLLAKPATDVVDPKEKAERDGHKARPGARRLVTCFPWSGVPKKEPLRQLSFVSTAPYPKGL